MTKRATLQHEFQSANILIVDDHSKRRDTLSKQIPCHSKLALTSQKAVNFFISQQITPNYNLIIIDDEIKTMKAQSLAKVIHALCDINKKPLLNAMFDFN